ncbi:MAG: hypothetical protein RI897_4049 [Verrucomicrobiota bacterium]
MPPFFVTEATVRRAGEDEGWPFGVVERWKSPAQTRWTRERGDVWLAGGLWLGVSSTQKRLLEGELKCDQGSGAEEEGLEMLNGLQEGIGVRTVGRRLTFAKPAAQCIQAAAQALAQVVESFQSQGQAQGIGGALE